VHVVDDLDLSLGDLGRDVPRLTEGRLGRLQAGVASGNDHIVRRNRTSLGRRSDSVGQNGVAHSAQVTVGEHEADVAPHKRQQSLVGGRRRNAAAKNLANHRVLAHQKDTFTTNRNANLLHVVRADIVSTNHQDLGVFVKLVVELFEE